MASKYGSPSNPTDPTELWALLSRRSAWTDGCLVWQDYTNPHGYGVIRTGGRRWLLHRLVWTLHNGHIPVETPVVCHRCDNTSCINPDHLFLGTQTDNLADMTAKGRRRGGNSNKMVCVNGHPFDEQNTGRYANGDRFCRKCARTRLHAYRARQKANQLRSQ